MNLYGLNFRAHCCIGFLIRLVFIVFGTLQDTYLEVGYTDVDYKVFSDAARHVVNGTSPYRRHTYRYSPLIAYLLIPNVIFHPVCGKVLFAVFDILVSILAYQILKNEGVSSHKCILSSLFWLYNPVPIIISTRGNADSLSALLVLLTTYCFKQKQIVHAGLIHGMSVHLRLYPVIFSVPLYIALKNDSSNKLVDLFYPSIDRIKLVISSTISFCGLFILFYNIYGQSFLFESMFFHLKRVDIRHNYSVYFYLQYLSFDIPSVFNRVAMVTPLVVLLICLPLYYSSAKDLPFCQLTMALVFVSYNSVLTCQYFVWPLCLLPLCLPHLSLSLTRSILVSSFWILSQLLWLFPAYLLEFKFQQSFLYIWIQGLVFFSSNILVLSSLIYGYVNKIKTV